MEVSLPTTASQLGSLSGAEIFGDSETPVTRLAPLNEAGEGALSFQADSKYSNLLDKVSSAVIFCKADAVREDGNTYLVVKDPKRAFSEVARAVSRKALRSGTDASAQVHPSAQLGNGVYVGPLAVIEEGAVIGPFTQIEAQCHIGPRVKIGTQCHLYPRATLLEGVWLGDRVKIFSGAILGSEGFGLFQAETGLGEIPQIGAVIIENDVRIGANCTIDRAMLGETRIGQGSKIDDQVHIGHNCVIGKQVIICAQTGLAGSVIIEDHVLVGGQVGIKDHTRIGTKARLGSQCGIIRDMEPDQDYWGTPAVPLFKSLRLFRYMEQLPQLFSRLKKLEGKWEGHEAK